MTWQEEKSEGVRSQKARTHHARMPSMFAGMPRGVMVTHTGKTKALAVGVQFL